MVNVDVEKLVRVKERTWIRLGNLRKLPERGNFNDVIEWLLNEQQKREEAKEML